jgi:hypothetical protein
MSSNVSNPHTLAVTNGSVQISDLVIDGGGESSALTNPQVTLFQNASVVFTNVTWQNISGMGLNGSKLNNVRITGNIFNKVGNRWKATFASADRHQAVSICCGDKTTWGLDIKLEGNTFTDIGLDPTSIGDAARVVSRGNVFNLANNQQALIPTATDFPAPIYVVRVDGATIVGNIATGASGNCIDAPGLRNATISGNNLNGCGGAGIGLFQGLDGVVLTGHISGTTLTVESVTSGTLAAGMVVASNAAGLVTDQTYIVSGSGTSWVVSKSQSVASGSSLFAGTNIKNVNVSGNVITNVYQGMAPAGTTWDGAVTLGGDYIDTVTVADNIITDDQAVHTMPYGVALEKRGSFAWNSAPYNLSVHDNSISNTTIAATLGIPATTISGCSASSVSGVLAGKFTSGVTGSCTPTLTLGSATIPASAGGWSCSFSNQTTANLFRQTASTPTTAAGSGTTVTGDVVSYACQPS